MPVINKPPIGLTDQEILCVIAYLQTLGGTATVTLQTSHAYYTAPGATPGAPPTRKPSLASSSRSPHRQPRKRHPVRAPAGANASRGAASGPPEEGLG